MNSDNISFDLTHVLRRLRLSGMLAMLPERLILAQKQDMPHQDFLTLILTDEATRRDSNALIIRAQRAHLNAEMRLENWDPTAKVSYDTRTFNELCSLRFINAKAHAAIVGPVGVGKTFMAHTIGHIACRHGYSVLAIRTDKLLKTLKHSRLDNSHESEFRKLINVDLLILDDFCLDAMDAVESRDLYDLLIERHRAGSIIATSNRGPDEWLATFSDPLRAQSAIDRFANNSYDLILEGESYRSRLKPTVPPDAGQRPVTIPITKKRTRRSRKKTQ